MKQKPLKPIAWEMLRLISERSTDGHFWAPQNRSDWYTDNRGAHEVYVWGSTVTGAIRTLTARGLVEKIPSPLGIWCRRTTRAGWQALAESDTMPPFRYGIGYHHREEMNQL